MQFSKFKAHPWHGIKRNENFDNPIIAFIEIVPNSVMKFEIDKESGYLIIDRPQKFSNSLPCLYGFIPQSYSGKNTAKYTEEKTGRINLVGDSDPLDICVFCEKEVIQSDIILKAIPIGGFRLIDNGEVDDKIIAIMPNDDWYGQIKDITEMPDAILNRLRHYFLTYKNLPSDKKQIEITDIYSKQEAIDVIKFAYKDYDELISR